MTIQWDIGKLPTENPPDPDSESPGAVGTATGADVKSVLERTTKTYRTPDANVQSESVARGVAS